MGTTPAVRPATPEDLDGMAEALSLAFHDDPVMQWLFGDQPPRPMRYTRPFFTIEGRRPLAHRTWRHVSGSCSTSPASPTRPIRRGDSTTARSSR